jgi:hypothetical protein
MFYLTFRRTPGEGSPHFDRFDGQNFTFPALLKGTGVSTSAEVDQRRCLWKLQAFEKA